MNLISFELLKLRRSRAFLFINSIPIVTLIISFISFIWKVDQDVLEKNLFYYQLESYVIANPFYNHQSRFFGLLFLVVLPVYIAATFSYSSYLDLKNNAFRLYANLGVNTLTVHLVKFFSVFLFFFLSLLISYLLLAITTLSLPYIKPDLIYENYNHYVAYGGIVMLKTIFLAIPSLIVHYWISLKLQSPTINVLISLVFLLVTFTLFNQTPYFLFIKGVSDSLTVFKLDIIDIQPIQWKQLLSFDFQTSAAVVIVLIMILLFSDLYANWWNKFFKKRKYIQ